jgi:hypothetical protein
LSENGLALEPDSDESLTPKPKDSRLSEHDFSALDPTLPDGRTGGRRDWEEQVSRQSRGDWRVETDDKRTKLRRETSGESSPAFPGLESGLVFWPLMKRLDESGLKSGLTSPKFDGKKTRLQLGKDS